MYLELKPHVNATETVSKQQAEVNKILLRRFHSTVLNDGHSQLLAHD